MKKLIKPSYTFTPGAANVGTIDFYGIKNFDVGKIYCLIHKPTGTIFYSLGIAGMSYSAVSTTMVTLQFNTSTFNANDPIDIVYDTDAIAVRGDGLSIWRYGFGGTAIDTNQMVVLQTGAGQAIRVGSVSKDATWTRSTTTCTITSVAHGLITNDAINILMYNEPLALVFGSVVVTVLTVDTFTIGCTNAGISSGGTITFGQDISNLQITTGVTAGSETILRSLNSFSGTLDFSCSLHLNQRLTTQEFRIGLYEISATHTGVSWTRSGTVLTITDTNHSLVAGQEIQIPVISDSAVGTLSMYQLINTPTTNTFQVTCLNAGATSGTLNYYSYDSVVDYKFNGATATSAIMETFRNVWDSPIAGTTTSSTSSVSMFKIKVAKGVIEFTDATGNSNTVETSRSIRDRELPDVSGNYYVMIRVRNLATAPASSTTMTLGFVQVNNTNSIPVEIAQRGSANLRGAVPMNLLASVNLTATVTPVDTQGGTLSKLQAVAGVALTVWSATTTGKVSQFVTDLIGRKIVKLFAPAELCWSNPPLVGGITTGTTPIVVKESAGAGLRNYVNSIELSNSTLGAGTELELRDADVVASSQTLASNILTTATHGLAIGDLVHITASGVTGLSVNTSYYVLTVPSATTLTFSATRGGSTLVISGTSVTATLHRVLWVGYVGVVAGGRDIKFDIPLKGTVASAMSIVTRTATTSGAIYANIQGHIAP